MATPLTAYYTAAGYPAGRWAGSGLIDLGDGRLHPGQEVTEAQMTALFGRAEDHAVRGADGIGEGVDRRGKASRVLGVGIVERKLGEGRSRLDRHALRRGGADRVLSKLSIKLLFNW